MNLLKGGNNRNILSAVLTVSVAFLIIFSTGASSLEILMGTTNSTYVLGNNVTFSINVTIDTGEIIPMNETYLNITGSNNSLTNCVLPFNSSGYSSHVVTCSGHELVVSLTTASNFTYGYGYLYANLTTGNTTPSANPYSWGYGYGYGTSGGVGTTTFNYTIKWLLPSTWLNDTYTGKIVFNTSSNKLYHSRTTFTAVSPSPSTSSAASGSSTWHSQAAAESGRECTESWVCSDWSECDDGTQTRTCVDSNTCNTTESRPIETRDCEEPSIAPIPEEPEVSPMLPSTQVPLGVWMFAALPVAILAGYLYFRQRKILRAKKLFTKIRPERSRRHRRRR